MAEAGIQVDTTISVRLPKDCLGADVREDVVILELNDQEAEELYGLLGKALHKSSFVLPQNPAPSYPTTPLPSYPGIGGHTSPWITLGTQGGTSFTYAPTATCDNSGGNS